MKTARLRLALLLLLAAAPATARADTLFAWDLSTVDPSPTAGSSLSLRVESAGIGHVAFWTPAVGVRYGVQQGATWTLETLPDAGVPPGAPGTLASNPDETNLIQHTSVRLALALNPYTPAEITLQLLPHLTPADLREVRASSQLSSRVREACFDKVEKPLH